jgi:prepilin peptidase CpaA
MQPSLFEGSATRLVAGSVFTLLLAIACVADIRTRRIPNRLVAVLSVAGLVFSVTTAPHPWQGFVSGIAGLGLGLALWIPFYALRWLGAGDVKLFAAAGAWLGPARTLEGAFIAAIAGGVLAIGWMVRAYGWKGFTVATSMSVAAVRSGGRAPLDPRSRHALPYGVALAIGSVAVAWFQVGA